MSEQILRLRGAQRALDGRGALSLGLRLIESGLIAPWQLFHARDRMAKWDASLIEILLARGWITPQNARDCLAHQHEALSVDLHREPPDPALADLLPPALCLRYNVIPWRRVGGLLMVATCAPDRLRDDAAHLPKILRAALTAVATREDIEQALVRHHRPALTLSTETRTAPALSCRTWNQNPHHMKRIWAILMCLALLTAAFPIAVLTLLTLWGALSLCAVSAMKVAAFAAGRTPEPPPPDGPQRLPRISVMVPLYKEKEIAQALVKRLARITYPEALLDVLLVLEEHDATTHATLARTTLPHWMRVVTVPSGSGLTTKPRALNYALDFCKGDIVGIWDAEDAPAPDQLDVVARHFASAPPDVVCVQGVLDYYNPYTNWISRCFTIEYATWFRTVLPGLARMGFAIPLGGTTLFIRRDAIEALGGWDAHNVTEDADLGMRIARFGWRTDLIPTVTHEEATCRPLAWVRQRSRWLKGYMVTYLVHMRRPLRLLQEIGPRRFLGFQLIFACTLSQFLLAPLIWFFWLDMIGVPHALSGILPKGMSMLLMGFGLINIVIAASSIKGQGRGALMPWIVTMVLYFPLATLAAYKALYELMFHPFYWDKTAHGKTEEGTRIDHAPAPGLQ